MDGQITAALIVSTLSLFGICINIYISNKNATLQRVFEEKKLRIELLESRRQLIQGILDKLQKSHCPITIEGNRYSCNPMPFLEDVKSFWGSIESFFEPIFCDEIVTRITDIKDFYLGRGKLKENDILPAVDTVYEKIDKKIKGKLRSIEDQINNLQDRNRSMSKSGKKN